MKKRIGKKMKREKILIAEELRMYTIRIKCKVSTKNLNCKVLFHANKIFFVCVVILMYTALLSLTF